MQESMICFSNVIFTQDFCPPILFKQCDRGFLYSMPFFLKFELNVSNKRTIIIKEKIAIPFNVICFISLIDQKCYEKRDLAVTLTDKTYVHVFLFFYYC